MTDFQYLEKGRHILLTIIRQRRWLLNHKLSQLPSSFTQEELKNIEYAKSIIRTGHSMKDYLERKQDTLAILISAVNRKCHDDLDTLTKTKINQSIIESTPKSNLVFNLLIIRYLIMYFNCFMYLALIIKRATNV